MQTTFSFGVFTRGWAAGVLLLATRSVAAAPPAVAPPGDRFELPPIVTAPGGPQIYEHSQEAGPDETFFLVGKGLSRDLLVWGVNADNPCGGPIHVKVQLATDRYLAATLPDRASDGPFVVAVKNRAGSSPPIVLNVPQPWWCGPDSAAPGEVVRVFGRNLSRRPDSQQAFVYVNKPGESGVWAKVVHSGKYTVAFRVPENLTPGPYEVWLHAGRGGLWGWGGPVKLWIEVLITPGPVTSFRPTGTTDLQKALHAMASQGGGILKLPSGTFSFTGTLHIGANVALRGASRDATTLQLVTSPGAAFPRLSGSAWGEAPQGMHTVGDTMTYALNVPQDGTWTVWLRYATEMSTWRQPGVSSNMVLQLDDGLPVPLMNLSNTGSFGTYKWSKSAAMKLTAGKHKLVWENVKGGGLSLDAMVFALDPAYVASDSPLPTDGPGRIVIQGEDCVNFVSKEGRLRGGERAAVWLTGDRASISDLTVLGNSQVNLGIAIRSADPLHWIRSCRVERVRLADCEGKQQENCGVHVRKLEQGQIRDNELWGRSPIYIAGARQTVFSGNRLVSVTRFGGNAEAAIQGRNETIEECVVEKNVVACPPGTEAGGPTARRLIWVSTGHGSITHNWFANNGVQQPAGPGAGMGAAQARFGGVAGTDQNVGETILFEANHRTAYFGPLSGADTQSVTLPKTLPDTPDDRLGSVRRDLLAHDSHGRETPFWPPDADDGSPEPPIHEYYVSIFAGPGQGQTRRVVQRVGERLLVDRPWRAAPQEGSLVAVGTGFYQNLIVGNNVPDGMTGIQLWISCIENVIAGNTIARQRKPGLFLYANGSTLASSMPRAWNRGISPLFWNVAEGNRAEECSDGALVTSGDAASLPIDFPRALGNVLRHNSFIRSRNDGVELTSRKTASGIKDASPSILGTIVEFNVVRDAAVAYHAGESCDATVLRRNHAYFWYPVNNSAQPPVAVLLNHGNANVAIESNTIEGRTGVGSSEIVELKKVDEVPPAPARTKNVKSGKS